MNHSKNETPEIINGNKAGIIQKRLRLFIFRQILKVTGNPVKSWKAMIKIRNLRRAAQANAKIKKFVRSDGKYYWVTDFPGLPAANLKYIIQLEFQRLKTRDEHTSSLKIPQQTLIWGITNRCSLQCSHCYDWENIASKDTLSLEQLKEILKHIEEHGIRHVQLSGGEPLVRFDDMIAILKEASGRIDFWLLTSGFGLTEEKAMALKEAGLIGANISLDHWDANAHNAFRNHSKSFEWVENAAKNCRDAGIMVSLSLCATREFVTEENLEKFALQARSLGTHFIRILEPRAVGRFAGQKVHLGNRQIKMLSHFMVRMNTLPEYKDFPIVIFFGHHQRNLGCMGSGNRYMYIDANGDFHACPFCRGAVGNALAMSFNDAISRLREKGCQAFRMYN